MTVKVFFSNGYYDIYTSHERGRKVFVYTTLFNPVFRVSDGWRIPVECAPQALLLLPWN
jgi:hypothetical protein